jgi:hypothetical protein
VVVPIFTLEWIEGEWKIATDGFMIGLSCWMFATSLATPQQSFADGGYAVDKLRVAPAQIGKWTIEIIKRSDIAKGFELLPRRWVVERTFAWLGRCR